MYKVMAQPPLPPPISSGSICEEVVTQSQWGSQMSSNDHRDTAGFLRDWKILGYTRLTEIAIAMLI